MKKRLRNILIGSVILLFVVFLVVWIVPLFSQKREFMENLTSEKSIQGTSIEQGIMEVKEKIDTGGKAVLLSKVLEEKDGYICAIRTSFGPMSLKVKGGNIREDIVWSDSNTTAFIIGNYVYRYSSMYGKWLRFNYSSGMELSKKQMTSGIFSESELLNKTKPEEVACVKAKIPDDDFVFPMSESLDVTAGLSGLGLTT